MRQKPNVKARFGVSDTAYAEAQIGRPVTQFGQVNLLAPGQLYGERIRQIDLGVKKIFRFASQRVTVGVDFLNLANNNVTLAFNGTFAPNTPGWGFPTTYMNPRVTRLNVEYTW